MHELSCDSRVDEIIYKLCSLINQDVKHFKLRDRASSY